MEPRIIKGHRFLCKKDVVMKGVGGRPEVSYTKGKVYRCEEYSPYPGGKHTVGYITDNQGRKWHAWPYDPQNHLWCHDSWTEFFDDLDKDKTDNQ